MKLKAFFILFCVTISYSVFAGDPKAVGDVVGRELSSTGLGSFGHVGMHAGSNVILEVLNKPTVIQQNSLTSFKNSSAYWGARYGKGSNFSTMISSGWAQRNYNPQYTITAQWQEGKVTQQCVKWSGGKCIQYSNVIIPAKFRCDTFLNYSYMKGTGSYLISLMTPSNFYKTMPYNR